MKNKLSATLFIAALIYISQAHIFTIHCAHENPPMNAIHALVSEIKTYKNKTGTLPADLSFASSNAQHNISRYKIKLDATKLKITSETSDYYDYPISYLLTFGLIGTPTTTSNYGFDLTQI